MDKGDILKEFGKNLRAERNRAGLSQEQLAEKIGVSYGQVVGTIERGETNTSLSVIVAIMDALDLHFEKLFDRNKFNRKI
ncbi:TPA: XRE family transcriptional regulator [Candidatus Gastranaerophilales bacterium HUM_20]|nr:predicted transcription factor [Clostridium sp. CAG:729]DAB24858.1 MAG TPA: XRE family transcriptional regulator [Candidatus Gastranaerophilales bacterium HUM_20]